MSNLSQWAKDVKKTLIDKDMTIRQLGEKIGYSAATISSVIGGRYSNTSYKEIVEKINSELGTRGMPIRITTPSDEWCCAVKIELVKRNMTISELAKKVGECRNRLSLVINGKMMNEEITKKVVKELEITIPVLPLSRN